MPHRLGHAGVFILLMSGLGGCVSLDAEVAREAIEEPANWAALSAERDAGTVTTNWVDDLGDPVVTGLIAEALAENNDLSAAAARVRAARAQAGITRAGLLPSVGGSFSANRFRSPSSNQPTIGPDGNLVIGGSGATYTNSGQLGLSLRWELDLWGRIADQTRAAYKEAFAGELDVSAAQLSLAGTIAQSYYGYTEARLQRQLSERDVETGEANLRIIERRYNRGVSSSLDVRLARSSLATSKATLLSRQQAEKEAARSLEVLLGRYPNASLQSAEDLPRLDPVVEETGLQVAVGSPETLIFRRPDVIAAEERLEAAGLRVAAARKAFLPTLSLIGSAEERDQLDMAELLDVDAVFASLIGNLSQPLFQGGRLRAQEQASRATLEALLYEYTQTVLLAFEEVENAIAAERFLSAREAAQQLAFEEAVAAEDLTNRQYVNGTTNIFNLINAQQRRISAESQYFAAIRGRLSNRIALYLALGAPFTLPGDDMIVESTPMQSEQESS